MTDTRILIAGAGGFIGGHLVADLTRRGHSNIRAVDIKPMDAWYQVFSEAENVIADLRTPEACIDACRDVTQIYNFASDMGGMGFIENNKTACMLSVLINTNLLSAASAANVDRYLFASSACVYNQDKQRSPDVTALIEEDAYPAMPEDGYGWEKLFSERMCRHFREDYGIHTRIARLHNVYGPHGTWRGGREKAPAAICRKVIEAKAKGGTVIEIWGDGKQTRSFTYIDDCVEGLNLLMNSDVEDPLNIGSAELVTINGLVDIVEEIGGVRLDRTYDPDAPRGVGGRNSDNTRIKAELSWEPSTALRDGMAATYRWIESEYARAESGSTS